MNKKPLNQFERYHPSQTRWEEWVEDRRGQRLYMTEAMKMLAQHLELSDQIFSRTSPEQFWRYRGDEWRVMRHNGALYAIRHSYTANSNSERISFAWIVPVREVDAFVEQVHKGGIYTATHWERPLEEVANVLGLGTPAEAVDMSEV